MSVSVVENQQEMEPINPGTKVFYFSILSVLCYETQWG